jgi:hypothetical protein
MSSLATRQQPNQMIDELPAEALPELADFIDYLRFKVVDANHLSIATLKQENWRSP